MSERRRAQVTKTERRPTATAHRPQAALSDYLATMLEEVTEDLAEEDLVEEEDAEEASEASEPADDSQPENEQARQAEPEPEPEATPEEAVSDPVTTVSARAHSPASVEEEPEAPVLEPQIEAAAADELAWEENGRPAWAQTRFDCLLFKVDGLSLAVPMVLLGTIHPLDRDLTPLFGQPDWFMGLYPVTDKRNIRVVETARLVMPERYREEAKKSLRYAIGIHGCNWALAAHEVVGSVTLSPEDVKWRRGRSRRPWLAGTVVDRMCALLDLQALESTLLRDQGRPDSVRRGAARPDAARPDAARPSHTDR